MAATHIGCSADIPSRTVDALRNSNLLIFEEDRPARALLKAAGLQREYCRYNEHGAKDGRGAHALEELESTLRKGGVVCFVSDQGTPGFADPGSHLVATAHRLKAKVQVVPGPNSIAAAIAGCPFRIERFTYEGFLPRSPDERRESFRDIAKRRNPTILLDTPYRLQQLLEDAQDSLANRESVVGLDLSGPDETWLWGTIRELTKQVADIASKKLNFVVIIQGTNQTK